MQGKRVRARTAGFSLTELMIVVAITGILAAIALPTFGTYIYKSRTSEAVSFLGVIKLRQESHRSEFGTYLGCGAGTNAISWFNDVSHFVPPKDSSSPRNLSVGWSPSGTMGTCFNSLGATPDGPVRFRYSWIAGSPADCAAGPCALLGITAADHFNIAQAHADLDDDGTWVVFELSNFTRNVFVMDTSGNANHQGWE